MSCSATLTGHGTALTLQTMKTSAALHELDPIRIRTGAIGYWSVPTASEVERTADQLLVRLETAPEGSLVPVILEEGMLTASCLAAILVPSLDRITTGKLPGRFIVLVDPEERHEFEADSALVRQSERLGGKFVCVWRGREGDAGLLGPVDSQVQLTYEFVLKRSALTGGVTARDLAEHFQLKIQAASNRLAKSAELGLVFRANRESVAGGGAQHVYLPVK